jgi:hypothetical protein
MGHMNTLLMFLTLAAPAPAPEAGPAKVAKPAKPVTVAKGSTAKVGLEAIEAQPGKNKNSKGLDAKLAKQLRTTLKLMGMSKPDLKSLGKNTKKMKKDDTTTMTVDPYEVKLTCKKVEKDSVTLKVELYKKIKDPKTKKVKKKAMVSPTTVKLSEKKSNHAMTVLQKDLKKKIFVVSKEK